MVCLIQIFSPLSLSNIHVIVYDYRYSKTSIFAFCLLVTHMPIEISLWRSALRNSALYVFLSPSVVMSYWLLKYIKFICARDESKIKTHGVVHYGYYFESDISNLNFRCLCFHQLLMCFSVGFLLALTLFIVFLWG